MSHIKLVDGPPDPAVRLLDKFWDVVVLAEISGPGRAWYRVLWSKEQHGWRDARTYGAGFSENTVDGVELDAETYRQIEKLARWCPWCGLGTEEHLIAPDVFGDPARYCVQRPTSEIVGGNGVRKHHGSLAIGCKSVEQGSWTVQVRQGHVVDAEPYFGEPLAASEIRDRAWCSRCLPRQNREESEKLDRSLLREQAQRVVEHFERA